MPTSSSGVFSSTEAHTARHVKRNLTVQLRYVYLHDLMITDNSDTVYYIIN